jgi:hypothetical protein
MRISNRGAVLVPSHHRKIKLLLMFSEAHASLVVGGTICVLFLLAIVMLIMDMNLYNSLFRHKRNNV